MASQSGEKVDSEEICRYVFGDKTKESGMNTGFMTDYDGIPYLGVRLNKRSRCKIIRRAKP